MTADFHLCVHDEVVVGFKTSPGPISMPMKNYLRKETPNNNEGGSRGDTVCKECLLAWLRNMAVDFHLSVHDEVVVGFKTPAGSISRPVRNYGKNGH
ncbi:hypothetical protein TSUD_407490 [Trifolium subterraneum]|uniref:Uncharacterized protein n=1 Tax=Trifolium subterraneum TaxID=3900 RepID=A0A2Z6PF86_TRISU|nr:hypothetical protein TSUD_407490 [Trifolium subterraneum]